MLGERYFATRERLSGLLADIAALAAETGTDLADLLPPRSLAQGLGPPFLFVVCGEVNAGKSTFLNGLFGQDLCRVNRLPETKQIINAQRLALLKKGAVVINTARGELVDVQAIVAALKSGHLLGYGADVLEQEPPPKDHPLFACPNAILTPHIGSRTYESVARQATMAAQNLIAVLSGQKPIAQANQV